MAARPEILFPLFADLKTLPGVGPKTAKYFEQMGIYCPRDMLFLLPHGQIDRRLRDTIKGAEIPGVVTVAVTVTAHRPAPRKGGAYRVLVEDSEDHFPIIFFHARGDYLDKLLPLDSRRIVSGKLELFDGQAQMVHPDHVLPVDQLGDLPEFEPIYPLTHGVTQRVMGKAAQGARGLAPDLPEWIDPELVVRQGWPNWVTSLKVAHNPTDDLTVLDKARTRLAYDELLAHQLTLALARSQTRKGKGRRTVGDGVLCEKVLKNLPYRPTSAQERAAKEIRDDMSAPARMSRLLQGDVGAGKTLVAVLALLTAVEAGGQGVMMAPTEILARQHLESISPLARDAGVRVEILTGRDKGGDRAAKLKALESGEIDILLGTHAVFQDDVVFHDLRLAIVDEQHRFGVKQRFSLGKKGAQADVLVMTATPIPRSLALTQYGDMDVSVLDEKPPGRKPIKTALVSTSRIEEVVNHLRTALTEGRQAYWVCPLVEESETIDLVAAEDRFKHLRAVLGDDRVALVHGQMPPSEKDAAMKEFVAGNRQVLVATTVIEVGVNVPNASIMVIEQADTFGLAQLHQLRGRVGRGDAQATCLLLYRNPMSETARKRLTLMRETEDGFRIAETDLEMRGAGDMIGTAQSGLPRFRVADLERDAGLMAIAQKDARTVLARDPKLESDRGLAARTLLWLMGQDEAIRLISVG